MRTTDNNGGKIIDTQILLHSEEDLCQMANRSISELEKQNPDFLIFPHSLGDFRTKLSITSKIFSFDKENRKLTTNNLMGFIGRNQTQITITSRFAKEDGHDYFLHYMLQKVLGLNLLNFEQTSGKEPLWDFLVYLFVYYLKEAYTQGIFKAYKHQYYNDANVKGALDVKRHLLKNIPFSGKIAYNVKEHSCDNPLTQLIRHTIEHIKSHTLGRHFLTKDVQVREIINQITFVTSKTYNKNVRQKVILLNLKPIRHPYFIKYGSLQKICLRILQHDRITFGKEKDKIYGLLFDGAWLWEEYINTLLKEKFYHPDNRTTRGGEYLFQKVEDGRKMQKIYPDFISKQKPCWVGDAKYIPLDRQERYQNEEKATSIYYKTLAYMYRLGSKNGFLIFPYKERNVKEDYRIIDTDGVLTKMGLGIPQQAYCFTEFQQTIQENEKQWKKDLFLQMGGEVPK